MTETEHRFTHTAMACDWEIALITDDADEADHATHAVCEEIDRLELELSRFVESSDIARIASLRDGQRMILGLDAFACLARARELFERSDGAFDVSLGGGLDRLELKESTREVTVHGDEPVAIDLGGIGKGHAVDIAVQLLRDDWDLTRGWITSGQSTVLPFGQPKVVAIRDPRNHTRALLELELSDLAFSGSGTALHGQHILDPRSGLPVLERIGAWAIAPSAAESDALSTTLMIANGVERARLFSTESASAGFWIEPDELGLEEPGSENLVHTELPPGVRIVSS